MGPMVLCALLAPSVASPQSLLREVVFTDPPTGMEVKSVAFNEEYVQLLTLKAGDQYFFVMGLDTVGPLKFRWGSSISLYESADDPGTFYYQSGGQLYGPVHGKDIANHRHPVSSDGRHLAVPMLQGDSIAIFIDGVMLMKVDTMSNRSLSINGRKATLLEAKESPFRSKDWLHFSNGGSHILCAENGFIHRLYVNGIAIDSSENVFYQMRVNDEGGYLYAKGRKPLPDEPWTYSYMFFLHTRDSVFGPVRTAWNCHLLDNGGYYYSGDDDGPSYILVNGVLYRGLRNIGNIIVLDPKNHLFTCSKDGKRLLNVNGHWHELDYEEVFHPVLDTAGDFALYGLRDHYLYKFVNGREEAEPLSRYGVRAIPLHINPAGESIHLFRTDDSTYVYHDDGMMLPQVANHVRPKAVQDSEWASYGLYDRREWKCVMPRLIYLEIGTSGHVLFNGTVSPPMIPIMEMSWSGEKQPGEIVAGALVEKGFFLVQRTGKDRFLINVNNAYHEEIDDLDEILYGSCDFDGARLVCFGKRKDSIHRITVTP